MSPTSVKSGRVPREAPSNGKVVRVWRFEGDDEALLDALKQNQPNAKRALFERYADHVQRVLIRIIGIDDAIPDLISETFLQAFSSIKTVRNGSSLKAWLSIIAVFTARGLIRKRKKRRTLWLFDTKAIEDSQIYEGDSESREALGVLYEILNEMPINERIVFSLRFVDGMVLREVAETCGVSMATVKRRLARAEDFFVPLAKQNALLAEWIERGERWRDR